MPLSGPPCTLPSRLGRAKRVTARDAQGAKHRWQAREGAPIEPRPAFIPDDEVVFVRLILDEVGLPTSSLPFPLHIPRPCQRGRRSSAPTVETRFH